MENAMLVKSTLTKAGPYWVMTDHPNRSRVFTDCPALVLVRRDGKLFGVVLDDCDRQQVRPIEEC